MYNPGEVSKTPERKVFGEYETIQLPVDSFVRLPQVRSEMNPELPNLKNSIKTRGLINPIDVARMDGEQLETYIDFVNETWNSEILIGEFGFNQQPDGYYYVVVAGHTRAEAINQLQQESDSGCEYIVTAKVHSISSPEEIISLQLDENLHSKPSLEQRAIAIVETYQYGLKNDVWKNKKQFLEQSKGKFSDDILNDALGFADLPSEARDFVFSKQLSYAAGVSIGRAADTIIKYEAAKLGYKDIPLKKTKKLEKAYNTRIGLIIASITNRSLNTSAAKRYVAGQVNMFTTELAKLNNDEKEDLGFLDFSMVSADEQTDEYIKGLERQLKEQLTLMKNNSVGSVMQALSLHRKLSKLGEEELLEEQDRRNRIFGSTAVSADVELTA